MPNYGQYRYSGGEYGGPPVFTQAGLETAGGLFPRRIVEVAFGNGPNDTNPTWVDITSDVTDIQTQRGRQHTLGRFEAGTMKVSVDNKSGKYSPFNSSGPYYNQIRPGMPIRFRAAWGANIYTVYYGFVESWPLVWPAANDSTVAVSAVDAMKFLNLKKPGSAGYYPGVVAADAPAVYYRFGDTVESTTATDSSGNNRTAMLFPFGGTASFGAAPLLTAELDGALDFGAYNLVADIATTRWDTGTFTISGVGPYTIEAWATVRSTTQGLGGATPGAVIFNAEPNPSTGVDVLSLAIMPNGTLRVDSSVSPGSGALAATSPSSVIGSQRHHFVGVISADGLTATLYIDGNLVAQTVVATAQNHTTKPLTEVTLGGSKTQRLLDGIVDEFAFYNAALSATQVANHYVAGSAPLAGQTTGQRIASLAAYTGIPATQQKIDTGNTVVQGATDNWLKDTILKSMQDQADTENGDLFIDAAGNLCFFDRYHTSHSPYSSVTIVLGDSGAPPEEPYRLGGTSVPYDDQDVWNEVVVTPAGLAAQIASDATSQQQYGKRTQSISTLSASVADAIGRASWELNLNKASVPRVDSIVVVPIDDPTMLFGPVLGSDVLSRVELRRRPMDGTASLFDQTALIEGIEHKVGKATWETTWRLSTVDAVIAGIFNESNFNQAVFAY